MHSCVCCRDTGSLVFHFVRLHGIILCLSLPRFIGTGILLSKNPTPSSGVIDDDTHCEWKMRSIIYCSILLLLAGSICLTHIDLVVGITASASSTTIIQHKQPTIGIVDDDRVDTTCTSTLQLILHRIRGGGDTDLDSSNLISDEDGNDDDEGDLDIDPVLTGRDDKDDDNDIDTPPVVFNGSFKDALIYAKQQGRLLIAFVPQKPNPMSSSSKSTSSSTDAKSIDNSIMSSLMSSEVAKVAQQAPPKSKQMKQANENAGSFVLWCCPGGIASSEATSLLKRIQGGTVQYKNASGQKRPILVALYPHASTTSASIVIPRLLTQHHCSPPPTTTKFVEWLRTIRKLNKKYYFKLQKQIQEYQWEQERKHGYKSSIQSDVEAKQREMKQELERQRLVQQEEAKKEQLQQRRIQLLKALDRVTASTSTPQTPAPTTTTIALRFSDGRSTSSSLVTEQRQLQRTFNEKATIRDVFHWVDAVHEIPYETMTLQTMNGKRSFVYEDPNDEDDTDENSGSSNKDLDVLLHEAGLGKMIGLRVILHK